MSHEEWRYTISDDDDDDDYQREDLVGKVLGIYLIMVEGRKGGFKVKRTFGQIEAVH